MSSISDVRTELAGVGTAGELGARFVAEYPQSPEPPLVVVGFPSRIELGTSTIDVAEIPLDLYVPGRGQPAEHALGELALAVRRHFHGLDVSTLSHVRSCRFVSLDDFGAVPVGSHQLLAATVTLSVHFKPA